MAKNTTKVAKASKATKHEANGVEVGTGGVKAKLVSQPEKIGEALEVKKTKDGWQDNNNGSWSKDGIVIRKEGNKNNGTDFVIYKGGKEVKNGRKPTLETAKEFVASKQGKSKKEAAATKDEKGSTLTWDWKKVDGKEEYETEQDDNVYRLKLHKDTGKWMMLKNGHPETALKPQQDLEWSKQAFEEFVTTGKIPSKAPKASGGDSKPRAPRQVGVARGRVKILGEFGTTGILHWMGKRDFTFEECKKVMDHFGADHLADSSIRTGRTDGKNEKYNREPQNVTAEQAAQLYDIAGKENPNKPAAKKPAKSKAKKAS